MKNKVIKGNNNEVNLKENTEVIFQQTAENTDSISWQAPEFEFNFKDVSWYWISLIIAIILIFVALWQKNFLFAVFIVFAELAVLYLANKSPQMWQFKINEKGIYIGESKLYEFAKIDCFDIHSYSSEFSELIIKLKSKLNPYIKIFIPPEDEKVIKDYLLNHIPQEELSESLVDSLEKLIRF